MVRIRDLPKMGREGEKKEPSPLDVFRNKVDDLVRKATPDTPGLDALRDINPDELHETDMELYNRFLSSQILVSELDSRLNSVDGLNESQKQLVLYMREQLLERLRLR